MTGCRQSPGSICPRRGAAWGGYGAAWAATSPAPATPPVRFFTKHKSRPLCFSRNTRHETRITAFMLFFPRFPGISRYFPVKKLLPTKCPRALRQLGHRLQDQSVVKSRLAPGTALRPADEARPESIWDLFDREATQFSRDASPLECREAFATDCNEEVSWR